MVELVRTVEVMEAMSWVCRVGKCSRDVRARRTCMGFEVIQWIGIGSLHCVVCMVPPQKRSIKDMYQVPVSVSKSSSNQLDSMITETNIKKLLKDVERLGSSSMPWKERKALENRNVVALGGKPLKKHRTPLSVAKPAMKNQKKRELKKMEEEQFLGQFTHRASNRKATEKRKPDGGLRATEGHFRKGILDVKHLLQPHPNPRSNESSFEGSKGKKKGKRKGKGKGKKKGKGKRKGR